MREWVEGRKFHQLRSADYELKNKLWESGLEFEKTVVDDDRLGLIRPSLENLGVEAGYHPDVLLSEIINNAESNLCFDNQNFFDTDHNWGKSGNLSNLITHSGVGTPASPTKIEFKQAFHAGYLQMLGWKNDQGQPLNRPTAGRLDNLLALVPLNMLEAATEAFESLLVNQGESNVLLARPEVQVWQYYPANSDYFDIYDMSGPMKPFVFQDRERLRVQTKGENDIETKDMKVMTQARYNLGYFAWWKAVRVRLAA